MYTILDLLIDKNLLERLNKKSFDIYWNKTRKKKKYGKPQQNKDGTFKYRNTQEPIPQLKYLQRKINLVLQKIPLPHEMYGSIMGKDNIMNATVHVHSSNFLTIDLKNYFSNITNTQVHQTLLSLGFSTNEARIITKLTTFEGRLPQGAPTSPTLANLVFSSTVKELAELCSDKGIIFTNYVDDLMFSASKRFKNHVPEIIAVIKRNGFFVNNKKISYRNRYSEVTGLFIRNGQLHLKKEMLENIENRGTKEYVKRVEEQNKILRRISTLKK
ncbi:reverse transcriptase family protein [Pedobacter nyackensis]|uniref:reverse transcriptase family protein n=1 Tax=Pedobacter nyackensis TaxID=475255 RepID=UPI00292F66A5|nr:reverse transcriptase family protein [Pedobacter nyackensis]